TLGDFPRALEEINHAQRLRPQSRSILASKGLILFYNGRKDEALRLLRQLAASEPDYLSPAAYLAAIHLVEREYEDFLLEERRAAQLLKDEARLATAERLAGVLRASGADAFLEAMLAEQERAYAIGKETAYTLARTLAMLGHTERAMGYLRTAKARGEASVILVRIDPALASLRPKAEFRELIAGLGLPPLG
ncbi:MAG: hypothetical protein AB7U38_12850, partial [Hyphomicrobiales bacterium]